MSWLNLKKGWSEKEKTAVLKSISYIVGADGVVHPNEQMLILGFLNKYHLSPEALRGVENMSQEEMTRIIRNLSSEDKELIFKYWEETITCDGHVDKQEVTVLIMMAEACGIDYAKLLNIR